MPPEDPAYFRQHSGHRNAAPEGGRLATPPGKSRNFPPRAARDKDTWSRSADILRQTPVQCCARYGAKEVWPKLFGLGSTFGPKKPRASQPNDRYGVAEFRVIGFPSVGRRSAWPRGNSCARV